MSTQSPQSTIRTAVAKHTAATVVPTAGEITGCRRATGAAAGRRARIDNPSSASVTSTPTATVEPNDTANTANNESQWMVIEDPSSRRRRGGDGDGHRGRDVV